MIKTVIAIYPGRFQPFGQHHAKSFKWLQQNFGAQNTYIATSDKVELPKSPFSFSEKKQIIDEYGLGDYVVQTKNPYKAEEILGSMDPATTAVVFMVGAKDMQNDPRFAMKPKRDGSDSYFQPYDKNKSNLQGFDKHGYLIVGPHVSIAIPGYGEMSGTALRKALGAKIPRSEKIKMFKAVFGWYDESTANMIFSKLEPISESKSSIAEMFKKSKSATTTKHKVEEQIFTKDWWSQIIDSVINEPISEGYPSQKQTDQHNAKIEKLRNYLRKHIGKEFSYSFNEFPKTVYGVKMQESVICEICNKPFRQITERHLKYKHDTTLNEYIDQYPTAKLLSDSLRKELRDNNPMKYIKNIKKIAETKLTRYGDKNYNNYEQSKKTKLEKYGNVTYNNPKFGRDNSSTRSDVRKLISKGVTESYVKNPALKNERSIIGKNFGFGNKQEFKKKMIDKGYWLSEDAKSEFSLYRNSVRNITEINYHTFFKEIPNAHLRSKKMHLDHKYSIFEGFMHDIDPEIIGHYKNLEIMSHYINESKNIKSSISLSKLVEEILNSKNTLDMGYQLLMCGGAGGHMAHPFNIDSVKTGKDLIDIFNKSITYLEKGPAAVKIDGVNASIRFVELNGKKQFVLDRGSMKPLDVQGITKTDLESRFGEGHGMIKIGGTVLDIFNAAIPKITSAIKSLGLWDNPNIMLNIEYVAGSTNVLQYDENFLAIHGLLELYQATPKRRATKEISYSKSAMQDLLNNLGETAKKYNYNVLGSIPTTLTSKPNLSTELNRKYTVTFNASTKETKTLLQWLSDAKVPDTTIKTIDGKTISALSKEVLMKISDGIPLDEFIADTKDYKDAVDGFVIYLATMKLGDAILDKLSSPLGPVKDHEGIVIRDKRIYNEPFKITGKFILGGLASSFRK